MSQNKEAFLKNLYDKLDTTPKDVSSHPYVPPFPLAEETLKDLTPEELWEVLEKACNKVQVNLVTTSKANLLESLNTLMDEYGNGQVLLPQVPLVQDYEIPQLDNENRRFVIWNQAGTKREENIQLAQDSNIAISFPKFLLAESATIVVESSDVQGRSFHFLPHNYIAIIPKSKLVPRITQAASYFNEKIEENQNIGSCIHFISGPSNSGDIEMQLVTGLHGPVAVSYLVIEDE